MSFAEKNSLKLCDYLSPASIVIEPSVVTKEFFFDQLIVKLCELSSLKDIESVRKAVWDREKEGRTVLENGLAIPHARYEGVKEIKACFGILPQGYEDPQEKLKVRAVFLFLSPQEHFRNHLQLLARISRVFQDKAFFELLLKDQNSDEAYAMLQQKEKSV